MLEAYYADTQPTHEETTSRMRELFAWEWRAFGKIDDTSAEETQQVIASLSNFNARVVANPALDAIIDELRNGQPVIISVDGNAFYDPQMPYPGAYHVVVLVGFEEANKEFIVHDPVRSSFMRHSYDNVMSAIHNYDAVTKEATGDPVAIFTSHKQ